MKIVFLIARILLGVTFVVFGLNKFVTFIPTGPLPEGVAGQFLGALFVSHFLWALATFEVAGGLLLLMNRYVPLALTLLGPIVVNILLYSLLMAPSGMPLALVTVVLWFVTYWSVRSAFTGIFQQRVAD
jgi:putative oxidoreductase